MTIHYHRDKATATVLSLMLRAFIDVGAVALDVAKACVEVGADPVYESVRMGSTVALLASVRWSRV